MKSFVNHSLKCSNDREKMNSQCETLTHASNQNREQLTFKKQAFSIFSLNPLGAFRTKQHFTRLRLPINKVSAPSRTNHG